MSYSWERNPVSDAVAYAASLPDATHYVRFPGMPSLRSCIPRLLYLQTSSTGCHITILDVYSYSIDRRFREDGFRQGSLSHRNPVCTSAGVAVAQGMPGR